MKKVSLVFVVLLAAAAALPAPASAALRNPQVALSGGNLQNLINSLNVEVIDVTQEQEDLQRWERNITGSGAFTLEIELGGNPSGTSIGVYNAVSDDNIVPGALFEVFPPAAQEGWYVVAQFNLNNTLDVTLFNGADVLQGVTHHDNVNVNNFGFYIQNGVNTGYGQDAVNDGDQARVLVFAGTGANNGGWFICFEEGPTPAISFDNDAVIDPESQDFDDAILFVESVRPVPARKSTWASLKSMYR